MVWSPDADDLRIAQLICDDPQQGLTQLLEQYGGRIRGYLRQRFPSLDGADVQDVITDAMLALAASFDAISRDVAGLVLAAGASARRAVASVAAIEPVGGE